MTYVFFLGNHPELSAIESWTVLTARGFSPKLKIGTDRFLIVELAQELPADFLRGLGGTDRIAKLLGSQVTPWAAIHILPFLPGDKKFMLGISDKSLAHQLKLLMREKGGRMKFVLPKGSTTYLNAAQVIFNKLTQAPNCELVIIPHQDQYYLAQTVQIQDIEAYEYRDTRRPARPGRVGMLPPKLAQIMINIAAGSSTNLAILDPFCGAGTVLQEGWLGGHRLTGADIEPSMIAAAQTNLDWLQKRFPVHGELTPILLQHDAQQAFPVEWSEKFDAIVSEPNLGIALTSPLPHQKIESAMTELGNLYIAFFKQVGAVLRPNGAIIFLLPAWRKRDSKHSDFWLFPDAFLDEIKRFGYSLEQLIPPELAPFYHSLPRNTLLYSRPDAFVGRELTLWKKL